MMKKPITSESCLCTFIIYTFTYIVYDAEEAHKKYEIYSAARL